MIDADCELHQEAVARGACTCSPATPINADRLLEDLDKVIKEREWLRHCLHVIGRQDPPLFLDDAVRGTLNDCIENLPPSPELTEGNRITSAERFETMVAEAKQAQR